jgi:DNA mismatch repair protein MutS2
MIGHTYQVLGYDELLTLLSGYSSCPLGHTNCLSLKPAIDLTFINNEHMLVTEMKLLLDTKGFFPFEGLVDITEILERCRAEGCCLESQDILSVLRTAEESWRSANLIGSHEPQLPSLYDLIKDLRVFDSLREGIKKAIDPGGRIKDSASPELKRIRSKKVQLRRSLHAKLDHIGRSHRLTSESGDCPVSIRDGRYVIRLRTDMKGRLKGIVHDYSRTQATCFFEPLEVIPDNNRLAEISQIEEEEEKKVLVALSSKVRDSAGDLSHAQAALGQLDGLCARAKFAGAMKCVRPVIDGKRVIDLKGARNPLLLGHMPDTSSIVPVDLFLDGSLNLLILSGPNKGGKTITLKTLGLLSLMAQAGIPVPAAEGSRLPVFRHILAEMGDDQDIHTGSSTFSAHVNHLKYMMAHADEESLIIIDEPGMATDPDEGAALAMAVLDHLSRTGAMIAVSTHYNRLKVYGLLNEKARNACMEFDVSRGQPSFSLRYGALGTSYAFEIARETGIKADILDQARQYLDRDEIHLNRLIEKLNLLIDEAARERLEAERIKKKYHSAREKMVSGLRRVESERKALMESKINEVEQFVRHAREEYRELTKSLKKAKPLSHALVQEGYHRIVENLREKLPLEAKGWKPVSNERFRIGQWARHKRHQQSGKIISLDKQQSKALLMAGNFKLSVDLGDLEVVSDEQKTERDGSWSDVSCTHSVYCSGEINLVGYRVSEAIPLLNRMIDSALVEGKPSVRIVHGYGTGRLRNAIREHLRGLPCVKRISSADAQGGGDAITLVELQ